MGNMDFIIKILEIIIVVVVTVYSVLTWYFFGRDPKRKAVVPEFVEPDYISSMFVAYINGERDSKEILKIGILSLILKGYISEIDEDGTGKRKYIMNKKNRDNLKLRKETLFQEENNLLDVLSENDLFGNKLGIIGFKNRIVHFLEKKYKMMIYKNNYSYFIPFILGIAICMAFTLSKLMQKDIASSMILTIFIFGWLAYVYSMQRGLLKFLYVTTTVGGFIGVILYADIFFGIIFIFIWLEYVHRMSEGILKFLYVAVMLGIIVAVMMYMEIYLGLSLFILGIIFLVYEKAIGKYTVSGQRKMEYIEGLKMYFETAEKNKIDKFEKEEEKLNYFNRIFPYIIALKVEDEKIGIFKDSLDFLNIMGSYAEAQYYVNEYVDRKFPIFRKKYIFW